jgi:Glycosyltransferase family 87
MLLFSPICWEHYLLLLLAPLAIVWMTLPATRFARTLFSTIVVAFWLGYPVTWTAFGLNGRTATPVDSLGILSYQFYALLGFFALALMILRQSGHPSVSPSAATRQTLALGAVVMAILWVHVLHSIWQRYGLFYFIGGDFGIYRSIATATLAEGSRAMNDLDLVAPFARELTRYYGPDAHNLNLGPGPYPAVYILPFLALTACSPIVGYAIWTMASLALAFAVVRGMTARFREGGWGLITSCVLFFPIVMALVYGQLTAMFFYGFYRAYRSLEGGRDFRAGLWTGALYLKPQYVVFLILVFLLARRWRALGGLMLAGLLVLLGSLAIVGPEGIRAQYETLRAMSGFRDVDPIIAPRWMINWRGLLATFLPEDVTGRTGKLITAILSIGTVGLLPLVWRGSWNPGSERFAVQMLATVVVMMLASYHNHIHSAALLLIPGLAVAAQRKRPRYLMAVLLVGLYAPLPLYFARASMMSVTWLLIALMLAALGIIVKGEVAALLGGGESWSASGGSDLRESEPSPAERLATT